MISINISRRQEYSQGDLGFTISGDNTHWLAEVLDVHNWGYDARLTRMHLNQETGRYSVEASSGTYSGVPRDKMQKFSLDKIDFSSLATWQKYVDEHRSKEHLPDLDSPFVQTITALTRQHKLKQA